MPSRFRPFPLSTRLALTLVASAAGALLMTGCGIGTSAISSNASPLVTSGFSGKIMGGPNPIANATVKLYTTGVSSNNTGYGGGEFVQEAVQKGSSAGQDTAADGSFSFQGGYFCPAGQFLYIQSIGGDTGAGFNSKAMLVAALGRCEDLFVNGQYSGGYIYLNELTTVAAAYALGNFSTFSGSGYFTTVNIGAPSANNAAVGCVANGTTCASTSAAGLRHAFQNAINLVNPFVGVANTTLPNNTSASVPARLINSIANALVTCVNSNGASTACQTIFAATGTDFQNGTIFQVAVNLAKNPTLAGSGYTPADFYAATTPQTLFYQPMLNSAPVDFSVAITIPKGTGVTVGTQGLSYPVSGTLDINDNYYVGNYNSTARTVSNAVSFKSDGTLASFTADSTLVTAGDGASIDKLGNLYLLGQDTTVTDGRISKFSTNPVTGAIAPTPTTIQYGNTPLIASAVDAQNNLWFGSYEGYITELPAGSTTPTFTRNARATVAAVAVDPNQNIWLTSSTYDSSNAVHVLQNNGTASAPIYSATSFLTGYDYAGFYASGISFAASSPYTAYVSNFGNGGSSAGAISTFTPTVSGVKVTNVSLNTSVKTGLNAPSNNQTDGAGMIWASDGSNIVKYTPGATSVVALSPCITSTVSTTCAPGPYSGVQSLSIDSAGSIWFVSSETGTVSEVIGSAVPVWPLLPLSSFGRPGDAAPVQP